MFFKVWAIFQGSSKQRAKKLPKETPGRPKWFPGAPREAQDGPRRRQERPKTAPRRPQEPPRATQEPPRGGLRAALVATWAPPAAQEAPGDLQGGILAPSGVDFRPSGGPFSKLPALVAEPSGEQAQAQGQAQAQAQSVYKRMANMLILASVLVLVLCLGSASKHYF